MLSRVQPRWLGLVVLIAALAFVLGGAMSGPSPALAHVEYASSEPAADSVLATAPRQAVVVFDGEISEAGSVLEVYGPDGSRVDNDDLRLDLDDLDRRRLIVSLPTGLGDGTYRVQVGGASMDGHTPELAEFPFTIAAASATPPLALATPLATPEATPASTPDATPVALVAANTERTQLHDGSTPLSGWWFAAVAVIAGLPILYIGWRNDRNHD